MLEWILAIGFAIIQLLVVFFVVFLLRKRQLWPLIMSGLKGHGEICIKFLPGMACSIHATTKPVENVSWIITDKNTGKKSKVFTRIESVKHVLLGSAIRLHLCPFNSATNVSIFSEENKGLSLKELNNIGVLGYAQGVVDTVEAIMPKKGFDIPWKVLIIVGVVVVLGVLIGPSVLEQIQAVA